MEDQTQKILLTLLLNIYYFPLNLKLITFYLMPAICFVMNITYEIPDHQLFFDKLKEGLTLRAQLKLPPPKLSEPIEAYGTSAK